MSVAVSNAWLTEASVGNPNTVSMNLSTEVKSYVVWSMPRLAHGEITPKGRLPDSSNVTLLVELTLDGDKAERYEPFAEGWLQGERAVVTLRCDLLEPFARGRVPGESDAMKTLASWCTVTTSSPLGPIRPSTSPRCTVRSTPPTASSPPVRQERLDRRDDVVVTEHDALGRAGRARGEDELEHLVVLGPDGIVDSGLVNPGKRHCGSFEWAAVPGLAPVQRLHVGRC